MELLMRRSSVAARPMPSQKRFFTVVERELGGLLPKMSDREDGIISFFSAFERTLELYEAGTSSYARLLPGCLSPKAFKVYSKLSLEQSKCYQTVKTQILSSFKLYSNAYLMKSLTAKRFGSETYQLFGNRLQELQTYYLDSKRIYLFEALTEDNLLEQFLCTLPSDIKSFVLARRPSNIREASDFVDLALPVSNERPRGNFRRDFVKPNSKHTSDELDKPDSQIATTGQNTTQTEDMKPESKVNIQCYVCKGPHKKVQCPNRQSKSGTGNFTVPTCFTYGDRNHKTGS
jgi:hypothetical protein